MRLVGLSQDAEVIRMSQWAESKARPAHLRRVEPRARSLDERVEADRLENLVSAARRTDDPRLAASRPPTPTSTAATRRPRVVPIAMPASVEQESRHVDPRNARMVGFHHGLIVNAPCAKS